MKKKRVKSMGVSKSKKRQKSSTDQLHMAMRLVIDTLIIGFCPEIDESCDLELLQKRSTVRKALDIMGSGFDVLADAAKGVHHA